MDLDDEELEATRELNKSKLIRECKYCKSKNLFIDIQGSRKGLYCKDCGKWQKWLNKYEYRILNNVNFGKFAYDKNYIVKINAGRQQGRSFQAGMIYANKKWEDKIKARIKELEEYLYRGNIKDDFLMIRIKAKIQELQSLLEKE